MNVILLKDVDKVGLRGDVVSVTRGYARNFLLPRKLAEEATDARGPELRKRESQRAPHRPSPGLRKQSRSSPRRSTPAPRTSRSSPPPTTSTRPSKPPWTTTSFSSSL